MWRVVRGLAIRFTRAASCITHADIAGILQLAKVVPDVVRRMVVDSPAASSYGNRGLKPPRVAVWEPSRGGCARRRNRAVRGPW